MPLRWKTKNRGKLTSISAVEHDLLLVADFIPRGAAYLALRDLLNRYQSDVNGTAANLQTKITTTEINLKYQQDRAKILESLRIRFPQSIRSMNTNQVIDLKEENSKFLPIDTQLVAIYSDTAAMEESLIRMRTQLAQVDLKREFLAKAYAVADAELDGLKLADQLLHVEKAVRDSLTTSSLESDQVLNGIKSDIVNIRISYNRGLQKHPASPASKKSYRLPTLLGFLGTSFLMLVFLFLHQGWQRYRSLT
ncbi:MAG: hypothetical protein AB1642_08380 [Pseudomonadota bacterium]